jgi:tRNA-splicing ligase RtcB
MDFTPVATQSPYAWLIEPQGKMRVPAIIYADQKLIEAMDRKVFEQISNVATLPGIQQAAYAMPDAHWGYGFPIGGVAAFDPGEGGVVSAGGVGFDISCGVRALHSGLTLDELHPHKKALADQLAVSIPAGLGSTGDIKLSHREMDRMLSGGAAWAVRQGYGTEADLARTEEHGCMGGADPGQVSDKAKERQRHEMGTLGSGNHYLEVQLIAQVYDTETAEAFDLREGEIVVSIHCGSRGLGHQIGTEFLKSMAIKARDHGIWLPDRELACAPIESPLGQSYLGAMRAGINCALANRQILTHLTRRVFEDVFAGPPLTLLYDVSHNTCKTETHEIEGRARQLFVHRKGATRALGPGHPDLPDGLRGVGQPVIIGGSMGTESYILAGTNQSEQLAFSSACHGAGRAMSRHQASKRWQGRDVIQELAARGILVKSPSLRGVAEEAPGAYKDVARVVDTAAMAGLSRKVARLEPVICVKG